MGIKHTIKKLLVGDAGESVLPKKDTDVNAAAPDIMENKTINTRQVGSIWQHKHDNLDWHTMSIPHPARSAFQDVEEGPHNEISQPTYPEMTLSKKNIICKFVVQGNERIGETISLDPGLLVFKSGAENLSIPVASILEITKEEVKVGEFDRDKALTLGDEWIRRTTNKLNFDEKGMLIND